MKAPYFKASVLSRPEEDGSTSILILLEVPCSNLNFIRDKKSQKFLSSFKTDISVENKTSGAVFKDFWTETVAKPGPGIPSVLKVYRIPNVQSGESKFSIKVQDLSSRAAATEENIPLSVSEYTSSNLGVSDILLLDQTLPNNEIIPNLMGQRPITRSSSDLSYHYRLFNPAGADTVEVRSWIFNPYKGDTLQTQTNIYATQGKKVLENVERYVNALVDPNLQPGRYELGISAIPKGKPEQGSTIKRPLLLHWEGVIADSDVAKAIEQMRYLEEYPEPFFGNSKEAKDYAKQMARELNRIRYIGRDDQFLMFTKETRDIHKQKLRWNEFKQFLKDYDQNFMTIYFVRVSEANQLYSTPSQEGWGTDRGMVHIVLGPPDEKMLEPFLREKKSHEVWTYHRHPVTQKMIQITFEADSGTNDFELAKGSRETWVKGESK
ncbi:MAG: GWxTD domain-containing protein [Elusimicrobia bacterium]|nr:GWxTD domain-containing protein [Elusimicrobiota bacterium]